MAKSFYKSHLFLSVGPKKKRAGFALVWSGLGWVIFLVLSLEPGLSVTLFL